jgi:hypothetical protein
MLKFLIIQENGIHDSNREFRECFSAQRALIKLGQSCDVWGKGHHNFNQIPNFNSYDVIINLENYDSGWVPDLSQYSKPIKLLWCIDAHVRGIEIYNQEFKRGKYHTMLQANKNYCITSNSIRTIWFPNCFDDELIYPMNIKGYFIGFCGSVLNREEWFNVIESKYLLKKDIWVLGKDMVRAINSYRIHFNKNISNDINYRSFETLGCSTVLLTNYDKQYQELGFRDEIDYLSYESKNDLMEKLNYCKNHLDYIYEVANNGYNFSKQHTYYKRMKFLLEEVLQCQN